MADDLCASHHKERCATADNNSCRLLLIDPSPLRREALRRLLEDLTANDNGCDFSIVGAIPSLDQADPDSSVGLVVLNSVVTSSDPQRLARSIHEAKQLFPYAPVVVISDRNEPAEVIASLRAGARGFITADIDPRLVFYALSFIAHGGVFFPPQTLLECLDGAEEADMRMIATPAPVSEMGASLTSLTARQKKVLQLLRQGQSNKRIAIDLNMCESTVKVHVREIMRKLKVANRTQAALCAANLELPDDISLEPLLAQQSQAGLERSEMRLIPA